MKIIVLLLASSLVGCQAFFRLNADEDPQVVVDRHVVGMQVGDFFQRHGAPFTREEARDGKLAFSWESGAAKVPAGPGGPEQLLCRLRISADPKGRIESAVIQRDGQGQRRLSRCVELFAAA